MKKVNIWLLTAAGFALLIGIFFLVRWLNPKEGTPSQEYKTKVAQYDSSLSGEKQKQEILDAVQVLTDKVIAHYKQDEINYRRAVEASDLQLKQIQKGYEKNTVVDTYDKSQLRRYVNEYRSNDEN